MMLGMSIELLTRIIHEASAAAAHPARRLIDSQGIGKKAGMRRWLRNSFPLNYLMAEVGCRTAVKFESESRKVHATHQGGMPGGHNFLRREITAECGGTAIQAKPDAMAAT
jgi:hypothetical protein